jgi:jumonji domain-containing protein 7
VIDGEKTFTLLPPTDIAFLPQQSYTTARYDIKSDRRNDISACSRILKDDLVLVVNENERVCWIPLDPDDPHVLEKYPDFAKVSICDDLKLASGLQK